MFFLIILLKKSSSFGTSNKTEIFLDIVHNLETQLSAVNPIGDLYKAQVWALSEYMGVPMKLLIKSLVLIFGKDRQMSRN